MICSQLNAETLETTEKSQEEVPIDAKDDGAYPPDSINEPMQTGEPIATPINVTAQGSASIEVTHQLPPPALRSSRIKPPASDQFTHSTQQAPLVQLTQSTQPNPPT